MQRIFFFIVELTNLFNELITLSQIIFLFLNNCAFRKYIYKKNSILFITKIIILIITNITKLLLNNNIYKIF